MHEQLWAKTEQLHGENQRWRPTCERQPADRGGMQQCMEELAWRVGLRRLQSQAADELLAAKSVAAKRACDQLAAPARAWVA